MFLKADGTEVWLRSSTRLPYLSLVGAIETSEQYAVIRSRLSRAYEMFPGMASDDAFLVLEAEGSKLVFCARPDKVCALLFLGKFTLAGDNKRIHSLESLVELVANSVNEISLRVGATIRFEVVQSELASQA
jgi:hypothetical protein